jgi:hypothetical protein
MPVFVLSVPDISPRLSVQLEILVQRRRSPRLRLRLSEFFSSQITHLWKRIEFAAEDECLRPSFSPSRRGNVRTSGKSVR